MTPERAAELASRIRADYTISMGAKEAIQQAILAACAEQREADAKIADKWANYCDINSSGNDAALCRTISKDIRSCA